MPPMTTAFGDRVGRELLVEDGVGDVLGRSLGKGSVLANPRVQVLLAAAFEVAVSGCEEEGGEFVIYKVLQLNSLNSHLTSH